MELCKTCMHILNFNFDLFFILFSENVKVHARWAWNYRKQRLLMKQVKLCRLWRKQILVAKEARRVDELCLRISLAEKILKGTERFKDLQKTVKAALKLLKNEVGPVELAGAKMVRGLVNRLSCGAEVQKLCVSALEAFDSTFSRPLRTDSVDEKQPSMFLSLPNFRTRRSIPILYSKKWKAFALI